MVGNAMSKCSIAFALLEPNKPTTSLRHNFDVDVRPGDPISAALQNTLLTMVQSNLATIRAGLQQDVPFVFEGDNLIEAWVVGQDPTIHVSAGFFDSSYKTPLTRAATVLHERAHTVLRAPGHPGIADGSGTATLVGLAPHEDKRPWYTNPNRFFEDALRNPYNYEWLCVHLDDRYQETSASNRISVNRLTCGCGAASIA